MKTTPEIPQKSTQDGEIRIVSDGTTYKLAVRIGENPWRYVSLI